MAGDQELILGEFPRTLDDRFRLSLPSELLGLLGTDETEFVLAKERPGCLSLWNQQTWSARFETSVELVKAKLKAGRLQAELGNVQLLGRLLSTRHRTIPVAGRGRLVLPEGFREFLQVDAGGDVILVGAAVCVELWQPAASIQYLDRQMPRFRRLLERLAE